MARIIETLRSLEDGNKAMVKIEFDARLDEYRCVLIDSAGCIVETADYFTNDKDDAMDTAAAMLGQFSKDNEWA